MEAQRKLLAAYDYVEKRRSQLRAAVARLQELYQWGHKSREEYLREHEELEREIGSLQPQEGQGAVLKKLATFLENVAQAWLDASEGQRNRLARQLFEAVWIREQRVMAVTPRPELKPLFDLRYDGLSKYVLQWRPGGDLNPRSSP